MSERDTPKGKSSSPSEARTTAQITRSRARTSIHSTTAAPSEIGRTACGVSNTYRDEGHAFGCVLSAGSRTGDSAYFTVAGACYARAVIHGLELKRT